MKKSKDFKILAAVIAPVVLIAVIMIAVISSKSGSTEIDFTKPCYAKIEIKDYGTITVELDHSAAPITVENFVKLAQSGFYDAPDNKRLHDAGRCAENRVCGNDKGRIFGERRGKSA